MASSGKKKTTMAKLSRESKLREKRMDKQARKEARKAAAADPDHPLNHRDDEFADPAAGEASESALVDA
jgi:protein required for attachment to host cells